MEDRPTQQVHTVGSDALCQPYTVSLSFRHKHIQYQRPRVGANRLPKSGYHIQNKSNRFQLRDLDKISVCTTWWAPDSSRYSRILTKWKASLWMDHIYTALFSFFNPWLYPTRHIYPPTRTHIHAVSDYRVRHRFLFLPSLIGSLSITHLRDVDCEAKNWTTNF